jgi:cobalt-zinc-cadmium efflux system outer membrane protein
MTIFKALLCPAFAVLALTVSPHSYAQDATPPAVKLEQAIIAALKKSPVLGASLARVEAATASRSQAGALPNPTLSIEADNIYGDYDGLDDAEITYGVSQMVELPGKRGSRIRLADAAATKSHYANDATRLDLIRDVTIAYTEMAIAQEDVTLLGEEYDLASEVRNSVAAKVEAGKEPPIQKNKSEIALSTSQIALERAHRTLYAKKQTLYALMGGHAGDFSVDLESLPAITPPQPLESYRTRLLQTPDAQSLNADIHQAQAELSLERANAMPDPTFNVGLKDMREDNTQALVAGVSFPLPVFNINRAGVARAGHELNAAKLDQHSTQLLLDTTLTAAYSALSNAYNEALTLEDSVLPGAEEAFHFAREGYEAGKFDYLEVLDAQRTLFDARRQFNTAILDYHRERAVIERMTAAHAEQHPAKESHHD